MTQRRDDIVRSERYFTATLLPLILFHDNYRGLRSFIDLLNSKLTTERDYSGVQHSATASVSNEPVPPMPLGYNFSRPSTRSRSVPSASTM